MGGLSSGAFCNHRKTQSVGALLSGIVESLGTIGVEVPRLD